MSEELRECPFLCELRDLEIDGTSKVIGYMCKGQCCDCQARRPTEDALKYDLAQKKAALLVIAQWCDRGLRNGMRKHDMNEVFLWIRKLAKEEMGKDYDTDR